MEERERSYRGTPEWDIVCQRQEIARIRSAHGESMHT